MDEIFQQVLCIVLSGIGSGNQPAQCFIPIVLYYTMCVFFFVQGSKVETFTGTEADFHRMRTQRGPVSSAGLA